MEVLTAGQANKLIRIRGYYRDGVSDNTRLYGSAREILDLLDIIKSLESFNTLARKMPELHGWSVTLRGVYKESLFRAPTALQFIVMSKTYDDTEILDAVKKRFGGRNSLLDGFEIIDYELHAIDERAMCVGTAIEG
jgi:hypothetical protein